MKKKRKMSVFKSSSLTNDPSGIESPPISAYESEVKINRSNKSTRQISFRVPGALLDSSKGYAETLGISINSLVCVALAEYLRERV